MLPKNLRLRKNSDYQRVYRKNVWGQNRDFKILARPHSLPENRYGFTLSGKYGKAYERNRMRRRLHEIVRLNESAFPRGYDYIIIPRQTVKDKDYAALQKTFFHCLDQLKKNMNKQKNRNKEEERKDRC